MIIKHYLQLLLHYRKPVLRIILTTTLGTAALSLLLLLVMPRYTGTASVVMMPTDPELAFTRSWTGASLYDPTAYMAQTQIEYLISLPVAERTLEKLAAEMAEMPKPTGLRATLIDAAKAVKLAYFWTFNMLNYGKFEPLTAYETSLNMLRKGLKIELVEGSYVLQISVALPSAEVAARAANVIAEAYRERVSEQFAAAGSQLQEFLDSEIARQEAVVADLVGQEIALSRELGILSLNEQMQFLQTSLDAEQAARSASQVKLAELAARVATIREQIQTVNQRELLAQMDEDLATEVMQREVLNQSIALHTGNIELFRAELEELAARQEPLTRLTTRRENAEADLQDLVERKRGVHLATYSSLSLVREISPAVVPKYPSSPMMLVYTVLGFIAGLFIAVFVLIAIDSTSDKVKTYSELQNVVGSRALALITPEMVAQARGRASLLLRRFDFLSGRIPDLSYRVGNPGTAPDRPLEILGFGTETVSVDCAVTLASALGLENRRVVCILPDEIDPPVLPAELQASVSFVRSDAVPQEPRAVYLAPRVGISPWDRLREGPRNGGLLIAIKAGLFTEDRLSSLFKAVKAASLDQTEFVLVTS